MQALLDFQLSQYVVTALILLSVAGVTFVLISPLLSKDELQKRKKSVVSQEVTVTANSGARYDVAQRRKNVQDHLKALEKQQVAQQKSSKKISFSDWVSQAGLTWSKPRFYLYSFICGCTLFFAFMIWGKGLAVASAFFFVGMFGVPRWYVSRLRKKRLHKFLEEFPTAIDIIVRGVKSGMPLGDCFQVAAREAKDPVGPELRAVIEKMHMGLSLPDALTQLPKRVPVPEANFLAIIIAIQSQAGGSLSEALGNLSKTLRDRKKMKGKIRAYSQEAKTSAAIIGSLPFLVAGAIFLMSPDYLGVLFETSIGRVIIAGGLLWMSIGVFVMRKMIDFKM